MIQLLLFFTIPLWLPLLAWYFSTWNATDPKYQEFIEKYGEDTLRDCVLKRYK